MYYQDEDGSWVIHARLPAEAGSIVIKAIAAVATAEPAEQQANVPAGTPADLELADLIEPRKSYGQARADAIVSMDNGRG